MRTADVIMTVIVIGLGWTFATECRSAEPVVKDSLTTVVQSITDADFADKALANGIHVVKFGAQWCGPCRELKPIYEAVASEFGKFATFHVFEVEQGSKADTRFKVTKIPCVIVFINGRECDRRIGSEIFVDGNVKAMFGLWIRHWIMGLRMHPELSPNEADVQKTIAEWRAMVAENAK